MNIKELMAKRAELIKSIKSATTMDELSEAQKNLEEVDGQIAFLNQKSSLIERLGAQGEPVKTVATSKAKSLGEHFVKFRESHDVIDHRVIAPPFKAAGDPTTTSGLTTIEYDTVPVRRVAAPLSVLDLFTRKSINSPVYSWTVYSTTTGSVGTTSEGSTKNKVTYGYIPKTATLQKITGFTKMTDELFEDAPYVVDAINQDLVDDLNANRQTQVVTTLLATSGLATDTVTYSTAVDIFQGILDAAADIEDTTNIAPDAVVVTPAIWKILRGAVDGEGHFYAGDPFSASDHKRLFEMTFIKNADVTANHLIVGAFGDSRVAALVSKSDGIRVESTNSNDTDFEKDLVSIRAECREILAVKRPACFCNVTLSANPS